MNWPVMKKYGTDIRKLPHAIMTFSCFFLSSVMPLTSFSQIPDRQLKTTLNEDLAEELWLVTDRDIYISGENLYFKVFCLDSQTGIPSFVSKVAYVSLLDHTASPVAQAKVWLEGASGSGSFIIPDSLTTGHYLISTCTHWMRNFSPGLFAGKMISVINPVRYKTPPENNQVSKLQATGESKNPDMKMPENSYPGKAEIIAKTEKKVFLPRERVSVSISTTDANGNPVKCDLVMSVVKAFTCDSTGHDFSCAMAIKPVSHKSDYSGLPVPEDSLFMPEPEGHLVSGTVYSSVTGEPVPNTDMVLSFVSKNALCKFDRTNKKGVFCFIVHESGKQEIVIQPFDQKADEFYVELNNPFPEVFAGYEPVDYVIDTAMLKEISDAIISMQVQTLYSPFIKTSSGVSRKVYVPDFYGAPAYEVHLEEFIRLSSLKEVIKELIPVAFTETRDGKTGLTLISSSPDEPYLINPFIMVDGVPVSDFEAVLNISPAEIEMIRVLNCRYYVSDISLGGIVDFKTVAGKLRSTNISVPGFRQEFDAPMSGSDFYSPQYLTEEEKLSRIPDFRNTLSWDPNIRTDSEGNAASEFYTSDEPGQYLISITGFTAEGLHVSGSVVISVLQP